jgi:hypothetical protein
MNNRESQLDDSSKSINLSHQFRNIIETNPLCASEFNLLNHRIFPKHLTFNDMSSADPERWHALSTHVVRDYCLRNAAVNFPANSIGYSIITAGLLRFPLSNIQN